MSSDTTFADETEEVDRASVQARVSDWRDRIDALYRQVQGWSPPEYRWDRSQHLTMHEERMRKFGVAPIELPVLGVFDAAGWRAKIVPYALWIIGGDGRLDLLAGARRFSITGVPPGVGSGWRISELEWRGSTAALDRSSWLAALR